MANPEHEKFLATVPLRDKVAAYMVTKGNDDLPLAHRIGVLRQWYGIISPMVACADPVVVCVGESTAGVESAAILANADRIIAEARRGWVHWEEIQGDIDHSICEDGSCVAMEKLRNTIARARDEEEGKS